MKTLPKEFIAEMEQMGADVFQRLLTVLTTTEPTVAVRLNPSRNRAGAIEPDAEPVEWHPRGFYLPNRRRFTLDPRFHQGVYYVQDASSMAMARAVRTAVEQLGDTGRELRYLDACAAPGGKTTAAIDELPETAFVVANEPDGHRVQILMENLSKWGVEAVVTREDATKMKLPSDFFDIIAADVPCSGEGMMRKDDFAVQQWSPQLVRECAARQWQIVRNLWDALRPGGILIYSTCTFNRCENEEIVERICRELGGEFVELPRIHGGVVGSQGAGSLSVWRFIPGEIRGEGLFMAMVRKPGEPSAERKGSKNRKKMQAEQTPPYIKDYLQGEYAYSLAGNEVVALRKAHETPYNELTKTLRPVSAGIEVGTIKGRDFIPSQQLALSRAYVRGSFPEYEVDLQTALAYLRREALTLADDAPRGLVLLTYSGNPLGWVKNLGNRANNLYPENWRIKNV